MEIAALVVGITAGLFVILFGSRGLLDLSKGIVERRRARKLTPAQDQAAAPPSGVTLPPPDAPALTPAPPAIYRHVFVGRQAELTILQAAFDKAASTKGSVVLVDGVSGIGKTTICEQLAQYVTPRRGDVRLFGAGDDVGDLGVLLVGQRPTLLVLDDGDQRTDDAIDRLVETPEAIAESRSLVVVTVETEQVDSNSSAFETMRRTAGFQRIHLRGLSLDDIHRFLDTLTWRAMTDEFAKAVHAETDGNPLYAEELVRYLAETGHLSMDADQWRWDGHLPPEVVASEAPSAIVRQRLASLGSDCQAVLNVAAAQGMTFEAAVIDRGPGLKGINVAAALDEASQRHILESVDRGQRLFRFSHPAVRQALVT